MKSCSLNNTKKYLIKKGYIKKIKNRYTPVKNLNQINGLLKTHALRKFSNLKSIEFFNNADFIYITQWNNLDFNFSLFELIDRKLGNYEYNVNYKIEGKSLLERGYTQEEWDNLSVKEREDIILNKKSKSVNDFYTTYTNSGKAVALLISEEEWNLLSDTEKENFKKCN